MLKKEHKKEAKKPLPRPETKNKYGRPKGRTAVTRDGINFWCTTGRRGFFFGASFLYSFFYSFFIRKNIMLPSVERSDGAGR